MDIFNGLKELEKHTRKFNVKSLNGRIRVQKNVYLLKVLRYSPALKYDFTNYIHGPYSTTLANTYYTEGKEKLQNSIPDRNLPKSTIDIIKEADDKGIQFLEALTTLISLSTQFVSPSSAVNSAKKLKPYMNETFWNESLEFLKKYQVLWKKP